MTVNELISKLEEIRGQYSGDLNIEYLDTYEENEYGVFEYLPIEAVKVVPSTAQWVVGIS